MQLPILSSQTTQWRRSYCQDFIYLFIYLFYYLFYFWLRWVFVAARGFFFSYSEQGLLFVAVRGLLVAVASLVVEHRL